MTAAECETGAPLTDEVRAAEEEKADVCALYSPT